MATLFFQHLKVRDSNSTHYFTPAEKYMEWKQIDDNATSTQYFLGNDNDSYPKLAKAEFLVNNQSKFAATSSEIQINNSSVLGFSNDSITIKKLLIAANINSTISTLDLKLQLLQPQSQESILETETLYVKRLYCDSIGG